MRALAILVAASIVMLAGRAADAHLMAADRGTLRVVDRAVFAALSLPVAALHGFDDDGDGLLSAAELERHGDALRAEIDRRAVIASAGAIATTVRVDLVLSPSHEAMQDRAAQVVALKHATFDEAPREVRFACDWIGAGHFAVTASRRNADATISETATLRAGASEHVFFGGAAPSTKALFVLGGLAALLAPTRPLLNRLRRARTPSRPCASRSDRCPSPARGSASRAETRTACR